MTLPRTLDWRPEGPSVRLLDQTRLPVAIAFVDCLTVAELIDAIRRLVVRGAPALGAVGALGVALAMTRLNPLLTVGAHLADTIAALRSARPTAVNLAWGVDEVLPLLPAGLPAVLAGARRLIAADEAANRLLAERGTEWILDRVRGERVNVLTHCNTGSLATTAWGTALGIVRTLNTRGRLGLVYADETRPLLQGSRLTAWELAGEGIDYRIQVDGAAASTIARGLVDVAIIGADRIARNGDTANKIGSLAVALACADAGVPFIVAAPASTLDLTTATGDGITIEQRPEAEVLHWGDAVVAPPGARAFNPAFDVTPARLIDAIVTEVGVVEPRLIADVSAIAAATPARV